MRSGYWIAFLKQGPPDPASRTVEAADERAPYPTGQGAFSFPNTMLRSRSHFSPQVDRYTGAGLAATGVVGAGGASVRAPTAQATCSTCFSVR